MNTNTVGYTSVKSAGSAPQAMPYMEQAFNDLENQTRCLDNALGLLENKLEKVLRPSTPTPVDNRKEGCAEVEHSAYCYSLRGYATMLQQFCSRINDLRDRAEC